MWVGKARAHQTKQDGDNPLYEILPNSRCDLAMQELEKLLKNDSIQLKKKTDDLAFSSNSFQPMSRNLTNPKMRAVVEKLCSIPKQPANIPPKIPYRTQDVGGWAREQELSNRSSITPHRGTAQFITRISPKTCNKRRNK